MELYERIVCVVMTGRRVELTPESQFKVLLCVYAYCTLLQGGYSTIDTSSLLTKRQMVSIVDQYVLATHTSAIRSQEDR